MNPSDQVSRRPGTACLAEERLSLYRDGGIEEPEAARIREHLAGCASCAKAFDELTPASRIAELLREARREIPPEVRDRLADFRPVDSKREPRDGTG